MKSIFDELSLKISKITTKRYSTSFSLGILFLKPAIRPAIYAIYGFVRFADEIVDSFHGFDKKNLLEEFELDTQKAIERKISLNPILNSFQKVVHDYQIEYELIDGFLQSMYMDLDPQNYDQKLYEKYIFGSAEVVGLMCLRVFTEGNNEEYEKLKPFAQKLGSAFQKVNFLRDFSADNKELGRVYFPNVAESDFNEDNKKVIEADIKSEFDESLIGIKMLPKNAQFGVYVAYIYYLSLFEKIKHKASYDVINGRIRIPNFQKCTLLIKSYFRYRLVGI